MTPQDFIALIKNLRLFINKGVNVWADMDKLLTRIEVRIDQTEPFNLPLTQEQTDLIIQIYSPLYIAALTAIEAAGDALNSDIVSKP